GPSKRVRDEPRAGPGGRRARAALRVSQAFRSPRVQAAAIRAPRNGARKTITRSATAIHRGLAAAVRTAAARQAAGLRLAAADQALTVGVRRTPSLRARAITKAKRRTKAAAAARTHRRQKAKAAATA